MTAIAERVAAGMAFLDERDPDWWKAGVPNAIDLDSLDLNHVDDCVLGQRCPLEGLDDPYEAQATALTGLTSWFAVDKWAIAHGFAVEGAEWDTWVELTAEWRRVIEARRARALLAPLADAVAEAETAGAL